MRSVLLFLAGCLATAPIVALERDGQIITLTEDEAAQCDAAGGCLVVPRAVLDLAVKEYAQRAFLAGKASCRNST